MRGGVRRLLVLTAAPSAASVRRDLDRARRLAVGTAGIPVDELAADAVLAAVDAVLDDAGGLPWDEVAFAELQRRVRDDAGTIARRTLETAADVLAAETRVRLRLAELTAEAARPVVDDAEAHLERLLPSGVRRRRPGRDGCRTCCATCAASSTGSNGSTSPATLAGGPRSCRWSSAIAALNRSGAAAPADLVEAGWLLEELRVSMFAQPLGTRVPVSATRVARALAAFEP